MPAGIHFRASSTWLAGLALALCLLIVWVVSTGNDGAEPDFSNRYSAQTQSFKVQVLARGIVEPAKVASIVSLLPGNRATIIWMAQEGVVVDAGEVVARFDPKPSEDQLAKDIRDLSDAQTRLIEARKLLSIRDQEQRGALEAAMREREISLLKADDIRFGSSQLELKKLKQKIKAAQRRLGLIEQEIQDFEVLFEKGYVSRKELEDVKNRRLVEQESLDLAMADLKNYQTYVLPRKLREAELLAEAADREYERVTRTSQAELKKLKEAVSVQESEVARLERQVQRTRAEIENTQVRSPISGVVLIKKTQRDSTERKFRVGDRVWNGQPFMEIPDNKELIVVSQVREVDIARIDEGMPVDIHLDAFADLKLQGKVVSINHHKEETVTGAQTFRVETKILDAPAHILPGLSAQVSITVDELKDTLAIPLAAVEYQAGQTGVWVEQGEEVVWRNLELGAAGSQWVAVKSGLNPGEVVLYNRF